MKLRLRGSPSFDYGSDLRPDTDNAVVGKYTKCIAAGISARGFFIRRGIAENKRSRFYPAKESKKMEMKNKPVYKLALSAIFVALATGLSFIKIWEMPLGGSITLLSMLPITMISIMLGLKWGIGSAFVYSLIQLMFGISEVLSWGLTPVMLVGTMLLDYILAFTVLGVAGAFVKKGYTGICAGVVLALGLRFLSHFLSGIIIFQKLDQFELFGTLFANRPYLYSFCYNGFYMIPEIIITTIAAVLLFRMSSVKKLMAQ